MPHHYILANLLAEAGAVGVLFLDELGETVDVACSEFPPDEMRVLGAYLGIYLRQLGAFLGSAQMGAPRLVHVEKRKLNIFARPLPDDYYLVLVQAQPALTGRARLALEKAADQLTQALF
jgi:predicted regulator of Ras-like GTPase activity (Roadblock/LC7/MglB family)